VKKYFLLTLLILLFFVAFAQHEGIQREFKSYKLYLTEDEDFTYVNDTLTDEFHLYLPQQKISYNNLGWMNPGHPYLPAVYSQNSGSQPFWFFNNLNGFIKTHDEVIYFDSKKPFTLFTFTGGGSGLEIAKFLHTQNITPTLSFAFNYEITNSDGYFQENKSKVNAMTFATAYTKKRYQSHFNFVMNKINLSENGGLEDMEAFETTGYETGAYSTNLSDAFTTMSQLGVQYNQEYRFGSYHSDTVVVNKDTAINKMFDSNFSLIHDFKIDRYYRIYEDIPSDFYANTFKTDTLTFDSVSYKTIENRFLINYNFAGENKIQKFQIMAGITNFMYNYHFPDTVKAQTYLSNYITGILNFDTNSGEFSSELNYCFMGTDMFDMNLSARYSQQISDNLGFEAYFDYSLENPAIFYYQYSSNNFQWEIDAAKIYSNSTGINFALDNMSLNFGVNGNLLKNYFIFNNLAMPVQVATANVIADAYVSKQFNFGKFHWFTKFTYQYIADRTKVPLPEFVGYSNLYFKKWIFHNAMQIQIGADVKYHSSIYGYAYMPSIGAFYLQDTKEFGNYPNAGIYIAVKVKRLRGFVKASNFNSTFMPRQYYLLYAMPDNPMSINFGISWEFYD
jgi:hypothetical protein